MSNTRKPTLKTGTKVLCTVSKFVPERISKRTGKLKPVQNLTKVVRGVVMKDNGEYITVSVIHPSQRTTVTRFFAHEVTVEADFVKGDLTV